MLNYLEYFMCNCVAGAKEEGIKVVIQMHQYLDKVSQFYASIFYITNSIIIFGSVSFWYQT